jgi:hypothetical protein
MARIIVGVVAVLAVVLLCPGTSHAGKARTAELVALSADPDQIDGVASVACDAGVGQCSFTRPDDGTLTPAVVFTLNTPGSVALQVGLWERPPDPISGDPGNLDCSGDVDDAIMGTLTFTVTGPVLVYIIFNPSLMTGDTLSLEWIVDACPITDCVNFNYGISPDACM